MQDVLSYIQKCGYVGYPLIILSTLMLGVILEYLWNTLRSYFLKDTICPSILNSRLELLQLVVSIAPMFGLLGTILGMIDSFAGFNDVSTIRMESVAKGISVAMYSTAFGMSVALISQIFGWLLERKLKRA
jgi:uncharacterized membrane protein required for colicin V production